MKKENKKEKIAAVVVTYNRKNLLLECLEALLKQTRPIDAMYIIDNFSSDGTPEALKENGYIINLPPDDISEPWEREFEVKNLTDGQPIKIHYIRMNKNTGGAGGFYEGVKRGYENGYDWLWLMDDDGLPAVDCLEALLKKKDKGNFLAPLVLRIDKPDELSFGLGQGMFTINECRNVAKNNIIPNVANPFNGILISSRLISMIGYPKKEMFIWGDETEYYLRALNSNLGVATVIDAIHYHPKDRMQLIQLQYTPYRVVYQDSKLRNYCMIRNQAYIAKKYNIIFLFKSILKYLYFFIICRMFDIDGLIFYFRASVHGLFEHWGGEKEYLDNSKG
jgi:GT2 family glycosyltransferase